MCVCVCVCVCVCAIDENLFPLIQIPLYVELFFDLIPSFFVLLTLNLFYLHQIYLCVSSFHLNL